MYRPRLLSRFKLFIASLLVAASLGCSGGISDLDDRDCRDDFEAEDGYRPRCEA